MDTILIDAISLFKVGWLDAYVHSVNLDDAFGEIDTDANGLASCFTLHDSSCSLLHEASLFSGW